MLLSLRGITGTSSCKNHAALESVEQALQEMCQWAGEIRPGRVIFQWEGMGKQGTIVGFL